MPTPNQDYAPSTAGAWLSADGSPIAVRDCVLTRKEGDKSVEQPCIFISSASKDKNLVPSFLYSTVNNIWENLQNWYIKNPEACKRLLETQNAILVLDSQKKFHGMGADGKGNNNIGLLLMKFRDDLNKAQETNSHKDLKDLISNLKSPTEDDLSALREALTTSVKAATFTRTSPILSFDEETNPAEKRKRFDKAFVAAIEADVKKAEAEQKAREEAAQLAQPPSTSPQDNRDKLLIKIATKKDQQGKEKPDITISGNTLTFTAELKLIKPEAGKSFEKPFEQVKVTRTYDSSKNEESFVFQHNTFEKKTGHTFENLKAFYAVSAKVSHELKQSSELAEMKKKGQYLTEDEEAKLAEANATTISLNLEGTTERDLYTASTISVHGVDREIPDAFKGKLLTNEAAALAAFLETGQEVTLKPALIPEKSLTMGPFTTLHIGSDIGVSDQTDAPRLR